MPSGNSAFAQKQQASEFEKAQLPLVQLLTFEPVGNPLQKASEAQRRHFFETLARSTASKKAGGSQAEHAHSQSQVILDRHNTPQPGSPKVSSPLYSLVYWSAMPAFRRAQESLATVLNEYAAGNEEKASEALGEFEYRLQAADYKADDLMAVLLLVIEDRVWEGKEPRVLPGSGQAPGARAQQWTVESKAGPQARLQQNKTEGEFPTPQIIKQEARQSASVRLASVREMLRYYFEKYPQEYHKAVCKVVDVDSGIQENTEYFQDQLAGKLADMGSFALAQLILSEIKSRHEMDTQECLLRLGYKYDVKLQRLILGKRTCGTRREAKGILSTLLANFMGKRMASRSLPPPSKKSRILSTRPRKPAAPG